MKGIINMTAKRFTQISSFLFGAFALYSAILAVPLALWFPRILVNDLVRFGFILTALIFGLGLLFPHRFTPALRRLAERITPAPVKFLCGLMMCVCLFVAMLSGAVNGWVVSPIVTGFFVAFVFPGLAFRNLSFTRPEKIGMQELSRLAGEKLRKGPKLKRGLVVTTLALLVIGLAWGILGKQTIPSPLWAALAGWIGIFGGGLMSVVIGRPVLQALPDSARRGSLPGLAFWGAVMLALSIFGCRAILLGAIPTGAAYFWGEETTQNAIVVKSSPDKRRKGCHGSVDLRIATGDLEICNLSRGFLEELTRGDTVVISGRATRFGQTIESFRLLEN
ncbi:MAG: hypothetical protein COB08_010590 [Rhodobacteraceae bacterium]|nr:hypothetical protein [Paracoccaceae bacterium]